MRRRLVIARSVLGRPISAVELGDPDEARTSLVVGVIHGDEPGGLAVVRRIERGPLPAAAVLWVSRPEPRWRRPWLAAERPPVDLNRNFPWRWRPLGQPGDQQYSGPRPLSERESRAAYRLILRLRPRVTLWFHQPLGITDRSGGDVRIERRFAALSGLPLRKLPRYPGSAASWQDRRLAASTAFVVELPPGRVGPAAAARYARAVRRIAF